MTDYEAGIVEIHQLSARIARQKRQLQQATEENQRLRDESYALLQRLHLAEEQRRQLSHVYQQQLEALRVTD